MSKYSIRPKRPTIFHAGDTYDSSDHGIRDFIFYGFGFVFFGLVTLGIGLVVLLIIFLRGVGSKQKRYLRRANALAICYKTSLRNAIKCEYPHGMAWILSNMVGALKDAGLDRQDPFRWEYGGFPDISRLKSALVLANAVDAQSDHILRLGEEAAMAQAMENIRNMLRQEDVWFGTKFLVSTGEWDDACYWYDWTEEDQQQYLKYKASSQTASPSIQQTVLLDRLTSKQSPVLSFESFTAENLASYEQYLKINPSLQYLSDQERKQEYAGYQQAEYQRYLKAIGGEEPRNDAGVRPPHGQVLPATEDDHDVW
jgi:hypothetical protein